MSKKSVIILLAVFFNSVWANATSFECRNEPGYLYCDEYDVRFTNPECKEYRYGSSQKVYDRDGNRLEAKPKNVFCTKDDFGLAAKQPHSPQYKLTGWIRDLREGDEVFFAYLSFSNYGIADELCKAVKKYNVKVDFVLDTSTNLSRAEVLQNCGNEQKFGDDTNWPELHLRGHSKGIGYAHNKVFMVNPNAAEDGEERMKIAFSSGNMSSGVVLHHENWHFITLRADSYFAQSHVCLMNGVLGEKSSSSKREYGKYISRCRSGLLEYYDEERDIKAFFVPGQVPWSNEWEGQRATRYLQNAIRSSDQILMGAHRFSYNKLLAALEDRLWQDDGVDMRLVCDDDTYWAGNGAKVGDNGSWEYWNVRGLEQQGMSVKYMQTNHDQHLLHHNKFLIFNGAKGGDAVFCGAGNLTGTAFNSNFENFYYIRIPEVVRAFNKQYDRMWNEMASSYRELPTKNVMPNSAF